MKRIKTIAALACCMTISAFAADQGVSLLDPPVSIYNHSDKSLEVVVYADAPKSLKVSRHVQYVKPHASNTQWQGIDYYAKKGSGTAMDQRNRVVVLVYDRANDQLLTSASKIVKTFGSGAIQKDKALVLNIEVKPKHSYQVDISISKQKPGRKMRQF